MLSFHRKSLPSVALMAGLAIDRGMPPSSMPCGQMYLQKYGEDIPAALFKNVGSMMTATSKMMYFR